MRMEAARRHRARRRGCKALNGTCRGILRESRRANPLSQQGNNYRKTTPAILRLVEVEITGSEGERRGGTIGRAIRGADNPRGFLVRHDVVGESALVRSYKVDDDDDDDEDDNEDGDDGEERTTPSSRVAMFRQNTCADFYGAPESEGGRWRIRNRWSGVAGNERSELLPGELPGMEKNS
ncbi:hypothetical protein KM043_004323 [Ampulex compressa]|nr:hypothetical protein KM043_004323 [Ampulex compressa]